MCCLQAIWHCSELLLGVGELCNSFIFNSLYLFWLSFNYIPTRFVLISIPRIYFLILCLQYFEKDITGHPSWKVFYYSFVNLAMHLFKVVLHFVAMLS